MQPRVRGFYEHPDVEFEFLKLKFLDIRKRTYKYLKLGRRTRLVAIPTTSGRFRGHGLCGNQRPGRDIIPPWQTTN